MRDHPPLIELCAAARERAWGDPFDPGDVSFYNAAREAVPKLLLDADHSGCLNSIRDWKDEAQRQEQENKRLHRELSSAAEALGLAIEESSYARADVIESLRAALKKARTAPAPKEKP